METKKRTHWKLLTNPDYLGSYDFSEGEERVVTVKEVKQVMVKGADGKESQCTTIFFVEPYKPMIMNSTNCKTLSKLADSPYIESWIGISFKIVVKQVKAFGDIIDALRIKSEKVDRKKPALLSSSENFLNCQKAYRADPQVLSSIKAKYEVSKEVEQLLIAKP